MTTPIAVIADSIAAPAPRPRTRAQIAQQLASLDAAFFDLLATLQSQTQSLRLQEQQIDAYRAQIRSLQELLWSEVGL